MAACGASQFLPLPAWFDFSIEGHVSPAVTHFPSMGNKKLLKALSFADLGIVVVLGAGYAILRLAGIIDPAFCISEDLQPVPRLSEAKVEIVYTNCDTLAKDEAISVYFSRPTVQGESRVSTWLNRRTLIFRYDPGRSDNPSPSITHSSKSTILISVPEVSSVIYQNRAWRGMSIEYAIGKVYCPPNPQGGIVIKK